MHAVGGEVALPEQARGRGRAGAEAVEDGAEGGQVEAAGAVPVREAVLGGDFGVGLVEVVGVDGEGVGRGEDGVEGGGEGGFAGGGGAGEGEEDGWGGGGGGLGGFGGVGRRRGGCGVRGPGGGHGGWRGRCRLRFGNGLNVRLEGKRLGLSGSSREDVWEHGGGLDVLLLGELIRMHR